MNELLFALGYGVASLVATVFIALATREDYDHIEDRIACSMVLGLAWPLILALMIARIPAEGVYHLIRWIVEKVEGER